MTSECGPTERLGAREASPLRASCLPAAGCGTPHLQRGVFRVAVRCPSGDHRAMLFASPSLLRRLPTAAGVLVVGLLAAAPAQASSPRVQHDRPAAQRALDRAQSLAS